MVQGKYPQYSRMELLKNGLNQSEAETQKSIQTLWLQDSFLCPQSLADSSRGKKREKQQEVLVSILLVPMQACGYSTSANSFNSPRLSRSCSKLEDLTNLYRFWTSKPAVLLPWSYISFNHSHFRDLQPPFLSFNPILTCLSSSVFDLSLAIICTTVGQEDPILFSVILLISTYTHTHPNTHTCSHKIICIHIHKYILNKQESET